MFDGVADHLPPLEGCLYCHTEGTTSLSESRKILGFGSDFPTLRCNHCDSVALFDYDPRDSQNWRIRYRRINNDPLYYYVAIYLGKAGWLSAREALAASTDGYVQRLRVQQVWDGNLDWLRPAPLNPPLSSMNPAEQVYLTLRAVTLQQAPPPGILVRPDYGSVLDSGKFYVTDQRLHLLGQRRNWWHDLDRVQRVDYDGRSWSVVVDTPDEPLLYRGTNSADQFDAQLVATVIDKLWELS